MRFHFKAIQKSLYLLVLLLLCLGGGARLTRETIVGIVGVKKSCFSIFYQFTFPFLMGNLSLTLSYGHSPQPYHCVCPLQIVVKSCSVHLKWISTYSRLGMTKYSNLSEITPQASTPLDWKRSIAPQA